MSNLETPIICNIYLYTYRLAIKLLYKLFNYSWIFNNSTRRVVKYIFHTQIGISKFVNDITLKTVRTDCSLAWISLASRCNFVIMHRHVEFD